MKVVIELNGFSDHPTSDVVHVHEEDRRAYLVLARLYNSFVSGVPDGSTQSGPITGKFFITE